MNVLIIIFGLCALSTVSAAEEDSTPIWDMIPLISQGKSLVQLVSGDTEGAKRTQNHFLNEGFGSSQLRSGYFLVTGEPGKAWTIQKKFLSNLEGVVDATPLVGHVKGAIHLLVGDRDHGWDAIKSATSSTGAMAGGIIAGPVGALGGHLMTDTMITATDTIINGNKSQLYGYVDYFANMKNCTPGEHFDVVASLVLDTTAAKKIKSKSKGSSESHVELTPLIDKVKLKKNKRIVGMPIPYDSGIETLDESGSEIRSQSEPESELGSESRPESESGSESRSGSESVSESRRESLSESGSVRDSDDTVEHESDSSDVARLIARQSSNKYEIYHRLKLHVFKNFLRNDPFCKILNLYYLRTLDLIRMEFYDLGAFEQDVFLDQLNVDFLKTRLSYLSDAEKSLIDTNDFRTVNRVMDPKSFLVSLAGIMKTTMAELQSLVLEHLQARDINVELETSDYLDELQHRNIISFEQSNIINGVRELNQYLKDRASELQNAHIIISKIGGDGRVQSVVLKYKMLNDKPVMLFVDYMYPGLLSPSFPHPFRLRSFININEFNQYAIFKINLAANEE